MSVSVLYLEICANCHFILTSISRLFLPAVVGPSSLQLQHHGATVTKMRTLPPADTQFKKSHRTVLCIPPEGTDEESGGKIGLWIGIGVFTC